MSATNDDRRNLASSRTDVVASQSVLKGAPARASVRLPVITPVQGIRVHRGERVASEKDAI